MAENKNMRDDTQLTEEERGKAIWIEIPARSIVNERQVPLPDFSAAPIINENGKEQQPPVLNEDGTPKMVTESKIAFDRNSDRANWMFTTKKKIFTPDEYGFNPETKQVENLGPSKTNKSFQVWEGAEYRITKTPIMTDEQGNPVMVDGKYKRDYTQTETETLTGAELKQSLDIRILRAKEAEKTAEKTADKVADKVAEKEQAYNAPARAGQAKTSASRFDDIMNKGKAKMAEADKTKPIIEAPENGAKTKKQTI